MILRPSDNTACNAAQGLEGPAARSTNQWTSCCSYATFVSGDPSGCLVYDENGDLAGNGFISDGCLVWQVDSGVVIDGPIVCSGVSGCC